jgi:hypothetical protein
MHALSRAVIGVRLPFVFITGLPHTSRDVLVWHFVKDTIWSQHDEVMIFLDLKLANFWFCFNYIDITSSVCQLSFRVTKSPRDWETAWKHSDWTDYVFRISCLLGGAASLLLLFRVSLNALGSGCLIDLSSSLDDPLILLDIGWLVVPTKRHDNLSTVDWDYWPAITYISTIACFSDY